MVYFQLIQVNISSFTQKRLLCSDPSIDNPHSRVVFHCDESASNPVFQTEDEDNYVSIDKEIAFCTVKAKFYYYIISAYIKAKRVILRTFDDVPSSYHLTLFSFLKCWTHGTRKLLHLKETTVKSSIFTSFETTKLLTHLLSLSLFVLYILFYCFQMIVIAYCFII